MNATSATRGDEWWQSTADKTGMTFAIADQLAVRALGCVLALGMLSGCSTSLQGDKPVPPTVSFDEAITEARADQQAVIDLISEVSPTSEWRVKVEERIDNCGANNDGRVAGLPLWVAEPGLPNADVQPTLEKIDTLLTARGYTKQQVNTPGDTTGALVEWFSPHGRITAGLGVNSIVSGAITCLPNR